MTDLENAYKNEPEGRICGYCNKPNDWADDIGYWYVVSKDNLNESKSACESCFYIHIPFHQQKYGVGDR